MVWNCVDRLVLSVEQTSFRKINVCLFFFGALKHISAVISILLYFPLVAII